MKKIILFLFLTIFLTNTNYTFACLPSIPSELEMTAITYVSPELTFYKEEYNNELKKRGYIKVPFSDNYRLAVFNDAKFMDYMTTSKLVTLRLSTGEVVHLFGGDGLRREDGTDNNYFDFSELKYSTHTRIDYADSYSNTLSSNVLVEVIIDKKVVMKYSARYFAGRDNPCPDNFDYDSDHDYTFYVYTAKELVLRYKYYVIASLVIVLEIAYLVIHKRRKLTAKK